VVGSTSRKPRDVGHPKRFTFQFPDVGHPPAGDSVCGGLIHQYRSRTPIRSKRRTQRNRIPMSKRVGKTFISELRIPRVDHTEKKNDATAVGRLSAFTVNGIINTNNSAETNITIAISCTKGCDACQIASATYSLVRSRLLLRKECKSWNLNF
jgi:hypothetical protein